MGRRRAGGVSGSCQGRTTAPKGAGRQGEVTEREIREVREQWDRAHSRWSAACDAIAVMRKLADDLSAECERLAEIIAEHDHAPIMTVVEPIAAAEAVRERPIVITEDDGGVE